ncbi:hypothetical protein KHQ82_05400 [Mycoplasmatota bacterium]|nr:hypothetical protein KHQ82_05400 [Mycoplasmatota bacterium]
MNNPAYVQKFDNVLRKVYLKDRLIFSQVQSTQLMGIHNNKVLEYGKKGLFPENYVFFSCRSIQDFGGKPYKDYNFLMKNIKNLVSNQNSVLEIYNNSHSHEELKTVLLYTQIPLQRNYEYLYYRYNYIFSFVNDKIDMNTVFYNKFGTSHIRFTDFMMSFIVTTNALKNYPMRYINMLNNLFRRFNDVVTELSQHRDKLINIHKLRRNKNRLFSILDLNILNSYPIVYFYNDKKYLEMAVPFVPSIVNACTESLLFRLTENKDGLRSIIGKEVLEEYVYHIIDTSTTSGVHKMIREFSYNKGDKFCDITLLDDHDNIILVEIKMGTPPLKIRDMNEKEINNYNKRISEVIVQAYKKITLLQSGSITSDDGSISLVAKSRLFGIAVLNSEIYHNKEGIYNFALNDLRDFGISVNMQELCEKVMIVSLYDFERWLHSGTQTIINYCEENKTSKTFFDVVYNPSGVNQSNLILEKYTTMLSTFVDEEKEHFELFLSKSKNNS